jgi:hypothetical protein
MVVFDADMVAKPNFFTKVGAGPRCLTHKGRADGSPRNPLTNGPALNQAL